MRLYEFIAALRLSDDDYDTFYQLVVAQDKEKATDRFWELVDGLEIITDSIVCEEILEIDGHKIIVEDKK
jgi:hypothetical protein